MSTLDEPRPTDAATTDAEHQAVLRLLSGLIATTAGRNYGVHLLQLAASLFGIEAISTPKGGWPSAKNVMRHPRFLPAEIDREWLIAENTGRFVLSVETINAFFPPEIHDGIWNLVLLGPRKLVRETERFIKSAAVGVEPDGSPRPRGRISEGGARFYVRAAQVLAKQIEALIELADDEELGIYLPDALDQWRNTRLPRMKSLHELGCVASQKDTSAPSLQTVRLAMRAAHVDVERRKATSRKDGLWTALRDRALLALIVFGPREETLMHLRVRDVLRDEDAIVFRKFKGKKLDQLIRRKRFPAEVMTWIYEYLDFVGIADQPDRSLWVRKCESSSVSDLPPSSWFHRVGKLCAAHTHSSERAHFNPHSFRHFAEIYGFRAGSRWIDAHLDGVLDPSVKGIPASPQTFADILIDHALHDITDRYKDLNNEDARERWFAVAAEGVWKWVWGDEGAPKSYDVELIRRRRESLDEATARHMQQLAMIDDLRRRKAAVEDERRAKRQLQRASAEALSERDLLLLLVENDETADEISRLSDRISDSIGGSAEAAVAVERARQALDAAKEVRIAVPDDADIADIEASAAALLADEAEPGEIDTDEAPAAPVLRRWVDTQEFLWALEYAISLSQLKRLMHGQSSFKQLFLPSSNGGDPKGIDRSSERRPRIYVDDLPLELYHPQVVKRLRWLMTQEWPVREVPGWQEQK